MAGPYDDRYKSRFEMWDDQAWVRSKPHRVEPFDPNLQYFSPELSTLLTHPEVAAAPPGIIKEILVYNLYTYLEFTVRLETGPVNEVCVMLRSPQFLPWLPSKMKDDALRIYTDEAGHAEMSHSLIAAVVKETRVAPVPQDPQFLGQLRQLYHDNLPAFQPFIKLFFVVVSETLITGTLTRLPQDRKVQTAVRDLARDHASDEGRHHAYFKQLFEYVWPKLPVPLRKKFGPMLPAVIHAFLAPDELGLRTILERFPSHFPDPYRIVSEIMHMDSTYSAILSGAQPTIRILRQVGLLEDEETREALARYRLV
ncbi:diiron oxygenase [Virgisporangium aurantiacum]|uniref:p-aminobenzoate N-oxygenase AurF n=1 Tax=Virgisporangium aurantiacum TaxID=175570 RepID=A0A8J3YZV4_9ACTN|nr:diiron oxygenase [Virgisporangium aurantiacum]GIJ53647.1 hypothetical protein Vau01_011630 [Virgisporangium aurantiacum]